MKLIKFFTLSMFVLFAVGCEKERAFVEYDDLEKGAFPRLLGDVTGSFNFFDPNNTGIEFTVEFYDENKGENVTEYNWKVAYGTTKDYKPLVSIPKSSFTKNANGLPSVKVSIKFADVLKALGRTINQVKGGDFFDLQGEIKTSKGQVFGFNNASANLIAEPAFRALFNVRGNIVCPSNLAGTYITETVGSSTDDCCTKNPYTLKGEVTLTAGASPGVYTISDFSGGLYKFWYAVPYPFNEAGLRKTITDACGIISGTSTEPFGESLKITGKVIDPVKGVFEFDWVTGYADKATVKLTKK
jgi:hypothetical protein